MTENEIGDIIVNTAIRLHQKLGSGLLESVYEAILEKQFQNQGLSVQRQVAVPFEYEGILFNEGFRADLILNDKVIIELKSVEYLNNAHKKQLLTYLKLSGKKLGYLLNFGEAVMKNGIVRIINGKLSSSREISSRRHET
ncbi:MAG: GxxExxY protein [Opitutales bacterium]|nr:GxxExxY protein [Opitutales bacterium]